MVVDGKNTARCRKHLRAEGGVFCMDCYTYCVLHKDLREDIKST